MVEIRGELPYCTMQYCTVTKNDWRQKVMTDMELSEEMYGVSKVDWASARN